MVKVDSSRGAAYVEAYSMRDGWRIGRRGYAALVNVQVTDPMSDNSRGRQQRIDALWRAWARNRGDLETLRELHAALGEYLTARSGG
jgi:hypothetical protein